ncbi:peptidase domain-containing ABC transporter [Psychrosphaera sp. 1_MG-2023]|uniref:peptidase domain-containing ABC transporter n=1 Tax=Psychrosphaera sp. 1_MG-2023 TaxID=3062643 RepID=UPI0026E4257A|nr:peptidase domain-containing ABC transporter [Psychrosphaera sp. 1_MG-2023]MDO6720658.1 peptidase domain-containing ABC transporter [Psychrosphaera sp. 1_MG-2023]
MNVILQSEASECGLSSIAMIANHFGYKTDMNHMRQKFPQTLKGTTLKQLIDIAAAINLSARALKLEVSDLTKLSLPCVIHWDMNHFVVLKQVNAKTIKIIDPARGEVSLSLEEFNKHFTGIALELSPNKQFNKQDQRGPRLTLGEIIAACHGLKSPLSQLLILSVMLQFITLAFPYYLQLVVDQVLPSFDGQFLVVLALGFGGLTLFNSAVASLRGATVIYLNNSMSKQLAFGLFNRVINLPLGFFEKRFIGDLVSRFSSLHNVRQIITNHLVEGVVDGLMAIGTLIMIYLYNTTLATIVVATMLVYLILRLCSFSSLKKSLEQNIHDRAVESSSFMENMRAIQTIKLFGLESQRQSIWQNLYISSLNSEIRVSKLQLFYQIINGLLFGIENVIVIFIGAQLVINSDANTTFSLGMLTAFIAYKSQLTQRFAALVDKFIEFKTLSIHLNRLSDFVSEPTESTAHQRQLPALSGELQIRDLNYRYSPTEKWLFSNLNLSVKPGESVAIIGASGCGKTTLLKVILGLLPPDSGEILWDGINQQNCNPHSLRSQVGSVMQNDQLLSGSIAANISQFSERYDIEHVMYCAKIAAIHDEIIEMPMGYHSLIGEMGVALSGGQVQRIILARALFQSPQILLLDEASAHLDIHSECQINLSLNDLKVTKIVVAHRPETIAHCDRVLELSGGRLTDVTSNFLNLKKQLVKID